jgi:hypothetical protein
MPPGKKTQRPSSNFMQCATASRVEKISLAWQFCTPPTYQEKIMMDIHQILKLLPHRYPILLVDRVLRLDKRIKALKNVSINEPFFMGHFPHPVMPGVLMLEARRKQPPYSAFTPWM